MSFDVNRNYENLFIDDTIYFSSPNYFNDPFDCGLDLRFKKKSRRYIKSHLINMLSNENPDLNNYQLNKAVEFIDKHFEDFNPDNINTRYSLVQNLNHFISRTGVCCFSEKKNNILMWSHYANRHKGICIGFNYKKLVDMLIHFNVKNNVLTYINKVIYKKYYPSLSGYKNDEMIDLLFIKSSNWKYEKEWRIIYSEGDDKKIGLPVNVISGIYLGLKIDPKNEDIIKKALSLKKYRIDLYKAKKVKNQFGLAFKKM